MSFGSFFKKVESEFLSMFKKAPTYTQLLQAGVTYLGPIALAAMALIDPADEAEAESIMGIVQSDLATLSAVAKSGQVAPGSSAAMTVEASLNSIQSNAAGLLQLSGVKNSAKVAQITALITLIDSEAQALLAGLAAPAAA